MEVKTLCSGAWTARLVTKGFEGRNFPTSKPYVTHKLPQVHPTGGVRAMAVATTPLQDQETYVWTGTDEFSTLGDRLDALPAPLPPIKVPRRVVLVRHGQSTWNAEGRIQGSSDESVLTAKGRTQAQATAARLENEKFDVLFHSPLKRATETANIIWGSRSGPVVVLPSLREVDLYSFQGLVKDEGKRLFGEMYSQWKYMPHDFVIDQHAPVRELWYRASLAWQEILKRPDSNSCLVVAHNAVNQALIATAVGLPPTFFRRLTQSNAATTVLDFMPAGSLPPYLIINRLNQSPSAPFGSEDGRGRGRGRVVLVPNGATASSQDGGLLGKSDEKLSTLGEVQAKKVAELLMDMQVDVLISSPHLRSVDTARDIAKLQVLAGFGTLQIKTTEKMSNRAWVSKDDGMVPDYEASEPMDSFWKRVGIAWERVVDTCRENNGQNVVVVAPASVICAMLCKSLGLELDRLSLFRTDACSVSVIEFNDLTALSADGTVRCVNYTAHLGRWAPPVTDPDPESIICGPEGCF